MSTRTLLRFANSLFSLMLGTAVTLCVLYSGYALWDNYQVYHSAGNVQSDLISLKPDAEAPNGPTFDELLAINPDVCAWLTVEGTNIDDPVVQGENNLVYMNRDVYGNFSLAGTLFLDSQNQRDFTDYYSIIYGHHMSYHMMFGDLDLFKEEDFFREHNKATIMIPGKVLKMEVLSGMVISAGDNRIFSPSYWSKGLDGMAEFLREYALFYNEDFLKKLEAHPKSYRLVALVTCSDGDTDDRTVVIIGGEKEHGNHGNNSGDSSSECDSSCESSADASGSCEGSISAPSLPTKPPKTGDNNRERLWISLLLISGSVFLLTLKRKKTS